MSHSGAHVWLQTECASDCTGRNRETCMAVCKHERAADDSGVPVGEGYLRAGGALAYASFGACELWRGGGSLCDRSPFPLPVIGMLDLDVCAMHMERALRVVKIHVAHAPARDQGGGKARAP